MSVTPFCFRLDPVCTLSVQGDSYHDSLHLPFGYEQFFKLDVAKRPGLTPIYHYWEYTFVKRFPLQSHWHIFVSHHVVQLTECIPSLSDYPFHFLYLVMVLNYHLPKIYITVDLLDLLSIDNHIISLLTCLLRTTLAFSRYVLRPTGLLMSWISCSISCSLEVELAMRTISSAKIRWNVFTVNPYPFVFPVDLLNDGVLQTWRKQFVGDIISLFGSSFKLNFSLSLWSRISVSL